MKRSTIITSSARTETRTVTPCPTIDRSTGVARLLVAGKPFLVRGVELHNSSSSSESAFARGLEAATRVHANTVLASVTWESVERAEGTFDFTGVASLLRQARESNLRLVLLWFGAWKNGASSYAPSWVKRDVDRFPRCRLENGAISDTVSPFGGSSLDEAAFVAFIRFIEEFDAHERTVVMVQIENEIGLLGSSRDHSEAATASFTAPIPAEVLTAMRARDGFQGTETLRWADVAANPLGRDEAFMAWGYASHVERLAASGRQHSSLPFFVNAWLDSDIDIDIPGFSVAGGQTPGMYPSGGPLPRVADVWTTIATHIDLFAPDVYFGDTAAIYADFSEMSGGLFIPEQRITEAGVGAAFLAIGEFDAIGVAPFGVDSRTDDELAALADGYQILSSVESLVGDSHRPRRGFHLHDQQPTASISFGDVRFDLSRAAAVGVDPAGMHGYGLIIQVDADVFLFAGRGFHSVVGATDPHGHVAIESVVEIHDSGVGRTLNGDETGGGTRVIHPSHTRLVSPFPIASGHEHSGISTLSVYRIKKQSS